MTNYDIEGTPPSVTPPIFPTPGATYTWGPPPPPPSKWTNTRVLLIVAGVIIVLLLILVGVTSASSSSSTSSETTTSDAPSYPPSTSSDWWAAICRSGTFYNGVKMFINAKAGSECTSKSGYPIYMGTFEEGMTFEAQNDVAQFGLAYMATVTTDSGDLWLFASSDPDALTPLAKYGIFATRAS